MRRWMAVLTVGLLGLTGCAWWTNIHGEVTPTSPKAANCASFFGPGGPSRVESLRPTFRWKPVAGPDAQYDLIIFEAYRRGRIIGREVYYREGLSEPEHRLDDSLRPKRLYLWSVRVRRAGSVSEWPWVHCTRVQLGYLAFGDLPVTEGAFPFFIFKTPSE